VGLLPKPRTSDISAHVPSTPSSSNRETDGEGGGIGQREKEREWDARSLSSISTSHSISPGKKVCIGMYPLYCSMYCVVLHK
jgi:hypothetical protein